MEMLTGFIIGVLVSSIVFYFYHNSLEEKRLAEYKETEANYYKYIKARLEDDYIRVQKMQSKYRRDNRPRTVHKNPYYDKHHVQGVIRKENNIKERVENIIKRREYDV